MKHTPKKGEAGYVEPGMETFRGGNADVTPSEEVVGSELTTGTIGKSSKMLGGASRRRRMRKGKSKGKSLRKKMTMKQRQQQQRQQQQRQQQQRRRR
jgi:hypothetical protein